jgi:Tol biopolymer transport system component
MPHLVLGPLRRPGVSWRRIVLSSRCLVPWLAPLALAGCPQLMDDEFEVGASQLGTAGAVSSPAAGGQASGGSAGTVGVAAAGPGSGGSSQGGTGASPAVAVTACEDGLMNGAELGVDCGGDCEPCGCDGTFQEPELVTGLGLVPKLWGPMPSRDNRTLYFSQQSETGAENIYQATRTDQRGSAFTAATPFTIMNSNGALDGTPFITPDGLSFFLFSSRGGNRDLYLSTRQSATADFSSPVLVQNVNTAQVEYLPWLAPDALGLFFVSTRSGGQGASDIWQARRGSLTDQWSNVTNVGELNTSQRDEGITLSRDGLTAIFASNRDGGEGDVDLWLALRTSLDGPFSEPINLTEVNSSADDVDPHLSNDGHELFFSSLRNGTQVLWHAWRDCP